MKKISVIVPVYNTEKFLAKCLNSLLNQTIIDQISILVINDGTKDNSEEIILDFAQKYPDTIEYYKKENSGVSATRNYGISKCKTEYVIPIDSDDYVEPTMLETMLAEMENKNVDIVCCGVKRCTTSGELICYEENFSKLYKDNKDAIDDLLDDKIPGYPGNKLYKTSLFKDNNISYPVGRIMLEDIVTTHLLFKAAKSVSAIDNIFYNYVRHDGAVSYRPTLRNASDILLALDDIIAAGSLNYQFIARMISFSDINYCKFINYPDFNINDIDKEFLNDYKKRLKGHKKQFGLFKILKNKKVSSKLKLHYTLSYLGMINIMYYFRLRILKRS